MRSFIVACFVALACSAASAQWENLVPLNDLGPGYYRQGYFGGLYDLGANTMPADHLADGIRFAKEIQPLDQDGNPSPDGKVVFLVAGMGDTGRVACSLYEGQDCEPGSFTSMVTGNPRVNPSFVVANAAHADFHTIMFTGYESGVLDRVRDTVLAREGVTESQVQAAWLQISSAHPDTSIDVARADAYLVKQGFGNTLRVLKARYPNLKIAYMSSRPFAGYSPNAWNVEPLAYETGLSVRWVAVQQIRQARGGCVCDDYRTGPVNYDWAPWTAWGPYVWANGQKPRSDGLTWQPEDYDGEFLSEKGAHKEAQLLFDFLATDPTAKIWFLAPSGRTHAVRH